MDLSPAHAAARAAAARHPANQASLDLLAAPPGPAQILIYDALDVLLVTVPLDPSVGSIDAENNRIVLATPIEAQIAESGQGAYAEILDGAGALWASGVTVSDDNGAGAIKVANADALLYAGAFVRITSAILHG